MTAAVRARRQVQEAGEAMEVLEWKSECGREVLEGMERCWWERERRC